MLEPCGLVRYGAHPVRIAVPEGVDADAGGKVGIRPAVRPGEGRPFARHDRRVKVRIGRHE